MTLNVEVLITLWAATEIRMVKDWAKLIAASPLINIGNTGAQRVQFSFCVIKIELKKKKKTAWNRLNEITARASRPARLSPGQFDPLKRCSIKNFTARARWADAKGNQRGYK